MKRSSKIAITVGVVLASVGLDALTRPVGNLLANDSIVGQLAHSNASSLANTYIGNGQWLTSAFVYAVLALVLVFVWTRKENSK